jgi:CDP-paratose 2-epimerase
MKILITGGAGFIGSSLSIRLREKYPDYSITAFDNLTRRGSEMNLPDFREMGIEFIHGDIRNREDLDAAGEFDVMVEASAEPSVLAGLDSDPSYIISNNLYGSVNCFNSCLKHQAKLVFLSTSRVYPFERIENARFIEEETRYSFAAEQPERGISGMGISEDLNLAGPRSFYGSTKLASELLIEEYAAFYGLKAAVTRFGVVAGPRQMGKTDQGVATLWMAKHYWKNPLTYIGYGGLGKQVRDILHIEDLAELVDMQIHETERFAGHVYNAGGGLTSSFSLLEMTRLCEKFTGNKINIGAEARTRPADLKAYISDNSKIRQETGWQPRKKPEQIFEDIFNWIRDNEKQLEPILK